MIKRITCLHIVILLLTVSASAQISLVNFSSGYSAPVDIKSCGDDRLFIVEQGGFIQICDTDGVQYARPFLDIEDSVRYGGEQGLLGLAFAPDYLTSGYFYVNYVDDLNGDTRISRFHVDPAYPDTVDPATEEILLTIYQPYSNHKGGHLGFGPDGYLYIGMGDGGSGGDPQNRAQNPDSLLGKMLRIKVDPSIPTYEIPPGNPFAIDTTLGRPEIWALGLRNPWRFSFDRLTGDLWIGDVGQNAVEEVNMQPAGSTGGWNFGWRCYEGNQGYSTAGCQMQSFYDAPVYAYNQAPTGYCTVVGGYVYRGTKFQEMYGKYFFVDYCISQFRYLEPDTLGFAHTSLGALGGATSVVSFGEDRHGEIYCSTGSGSVYRFVSADCTPVAVINSGKDTITDCGTGSVNLSIHENAGFTYLWTINGDTASTADTCFADQEGVYVLIVTNQTCSNSDSVFVDTIAPLNVTFNNLDTFYCVYSSPSNLLPNYLGGTFSGAGIQNASFNPTVAGIGDHDITYTYTDPTGCTYSQTQSVHVDECLGVPENVWTNSVSIFPNPSKGNFYVDAFSGSQKTINIEIFDMTGRLTYKEELVLNTGYNKVTVNSKLSGGIYVIKISDDKTSSSQRLVVQ